MRATLGRIVREHLSPRERLTVSQWADRYRIMRLAAAAGPWRTSRVPHLREIMDSWSDPDVRRVTVMKGSQSGGTESAYNCIFWAVDQAPGLLMFVYPDAGSGQDQNEVRFVPEAHASPQVEKYFTARKHDVKSRRLKLTSMDLLFRGAMSEHKIESFPCRYVIVDELDRCPAGTAHLAAQRIKTYPDGKMMLIGKPGLAGEGIDHEFDQGDRREYMVPCPTCGRYHERRRNRLRWPGLDRDGKPSDDTRDYRVPMNQRAQTAARAWFKCPHCGGRCGAEHHRWQIALGVWCPQGCGVSDLVKGSDGAWLDMPGRLAGPIPTGPNQHRSYHVPEWISGLLDNPYADGVSGLLERGGEVDAHWMTDHEGRGWQAPGASADVRGLTTRVETDKAKGLGYTLGTVPDGVIVLVASVDVQETHAYVAVTGYGAAGKERWLVWCERVSCPPNPEALALAALDPVLYGRTWRRQDGRDMRIAVRCIDTGDRSDEVYAYLARRTAIVGVRGVGTGARQQYMDGPYVWSKLDPDKRPSLGKTQAARAGMDVLRINSNWWKVAVLRRLGTAASGVAPPAAMEDDEAVDLDRTAVWHFASDTPAEYFEQLTSEERVAIVERGKTVRMWRLKKGRRANHYFDCACYGEALAVAGGVERCMGIKGLVGVGAGVETSAAAAKPAARQRTGGPTLRGQMTSLRKGRDHGKEDQDRSGGPGGRRG